jgi:predicted short-subunit dehydrogenase-like oxidoreductase (DUF2520 family)
VKVFVLGRGKLGRALHAELAASGVEVSLLSARGLSSLARFDRATVARGGARCFVLAVPDAAIRSVSERLAAQLSRHDSVLHCAGSRGPEELAACAAQGAATAGFHPLVSFASRRSLASLAGASFVTTGAPRALRHARWLCRKLGARCLAAPVLGPAYHAAAALLANGSAALSYAAVQILLDLGLGRRDAERALAGLLASVAFNVQRVGVPAALTGPVARGDYATVNRHLRALAELDREHRANYRRLLPLIERCAEAQRDAARPRPARKKGSAARKSAQGQAPRRSLRAQRQR